MIEQAQDAEAIFLAALEKATPQERAAFVEVACAGRAELLQRVRELLASHDESHGPLDAPPRGIDDTINQPSIAEGPGTVIGPYKLLQKIGEGGMGVVFMAEQQEPVRRKVALKITKPGMDSGQVIARFESERQALAMMDHPNIARVLDAGATEAGRPYFVMELVHGVSITKYCDDNRLTLRQRLELFVPVCQAIHHAHQKSIIHRDIKPSNVMITLCDGKPVPKVIDFGVAKATEQRLTERTLFTQYGTMIGTMEYMSPEQAEMSALGVDTRSDIYSLGVLLYELLTGSTPLIKQRVHAAGLSEILRMIKDEEPPTPSKRLSQSGDALASISAQRQTEPAKLASLLRDEVDWIVMKCLEKDRTRRYDSAAALAKDVQRHLADDPYEPVEARPPSAAYRLGKLARRYKTALAVSGAFVLLLVVGLVVSAWQTTQAQAERDRAQMVLTLQVAERLDGEMKQLEAVAGTIERALAQREDWEREYLVAWLSDLVDKDTRIHGITLAYQPGEGPQKQQAFPFLGAGAVGLSGSPQADGPLVAASALVAGKLQMYCLYVHRSSKSPTRIAATDLLPPKYNYLEMHWFTKPLDGNAQWTGPGFDGAPGEEFWMISYSLPMWRKHKNGQREPVGVLTVDLRMDYFKKVSTWVSGLRLGEKSFGDRSYGFVVNGRDISDGTGKDATGAFVSHPYFPAGADRKQQPQVITKLEHVDPAFSKLADRILELKEGRGSAIDPATGKRSTFLFAPVPSTKWAFVAVIEE